MAAMQRREYAKRARRKKNETKSKIIESLGSEKEQLLKKLAEIDVPLPENKEKLRDFVAETMKAAAEKRIPSQTATSLAQLAKVQLQLLNDSGEDYGDPQAMTDAELMAQLKKVANSGN